MSVFMKQTLVNVYRYLECIILQHILGSPPKDKLFGDSSFRVLVVVAASDNFFFCCLFAAMKNGAKPLFEIAFVFLTFIKPWENICELFVFQLEEELEIVSIKRLNSKPESRFCNHFETQFLIPSKTGKQVNTNYKRPITDKIIS